MSWFKAGEVVSTEKKISLDFTGSNVVSIPSPAKLARGEISGEKKICLDLTGRKNGVFVASPDHKVTDGESEKGGKDLKETVVVKKPLPKHHFIVKIVLSTFFQLLVLLFKLMIRRSFGNRQYDKDAVSVPPQTDYNRVIAEVEARFERLEKSFEKKIEKHAADGLGRVDYALASGLEGGMVVKHSEPYMVSWLSLKVVHSDAVKMLRPSFGEPGECFSLKGNNGFVQIRLRTPIIPEAFTLEHVSKSVAYDRSSAPKDCKVFGWFSGHENDDMADMHKMLLLTEFTYDLEKSNVQTFNVLDMVAGFGIVDMIMLEFTSNHGSPSNTCIYRLRVHG